MESVTATLESELPSEDDTAMRDTRVEQLLEEWNLSYELDPALPLSRVRDEEAVQIRNASHRAPKATVEQYMVHMRHGAKFPPIVVTSTGLLVDGNTRLAACQQLKLKTYPAYKVKFPLLPIAKMVGAALNQMGGDRLSDEEIVVAAEAMMAQEYPDEAIARALGRSVNHVRNVRKDRTFREAAERTGLTNVRIAKKTQRILAGIQHDEPFKAAVALVERAKPSEKDTVVLVQRIDNTRSDAEALSAIEVIGTEWGKPVGPPPGGQRSLSRTKAKKALGYAKALLAVSDEPASLVLVDDEDSLHVYEQLNVLVTKIVAAYSVPKA